MIRVVLAVVLATALLGVSLPAIDDARQDHTEKTVRTQLQQVEQAMAHLLDTDDPTDEGARRIVTIRLPERSWTDAGIDVVTIGAIPGGSGGRFTWSVDGGTRNVRHLPGISFRTVGETALSLTDSGRHRLVLSLDGNRTDPVVTVRRFTSRDGASGTHATVATDPRSRLGRRVRV